jgi:hypothetical protein
VCIAFDRSGNSNRCEFSVTVNVTLPLLAIRRSDTTIRVSWPDWAECFTLEMSVGLATNASWIPAPAQAILEDGRWSVDLPVTGGQRFFRLKRSLGP